MRDIKHYLKSMPVLYLLAILLSLSACAGRDATEKRMSEIVDEYCQKIPGSPVYHRGTIARGDAGSETSGADYIVHRIKYGVVVEEVRGYSLGRRLAFRCGSD